MRRFRGRFPGDGSLAPLAVLQDSFEGLENQPVEPVVVNRIMFSCCFPSLLALKINCKAETKEVTLNCEACCGGFGFIEFIRVSNRSALLARLRVFDTKLDFAADRVQRDGAFF